MNTKQSEKAASAPKYLPLYYSYLDQLQLLTPQQVGLLTLALLRRGRDGVEPEFPAGSALAMAYAFIDSEAQRAQERGRLARQRRQAGGASRAGAPRDARGRFLPAAHAREISPDDAQEGGEASDADGADGADGTEGLCSAAKAAAPGCTGGRRAGSDNLLPESAHARGEWFTLQDREEILHYSRQIVGPMTAAQERSILEAGRGMTYDSVMEALAIAHDYCAHTPQYLVASIETQRAHPERRFGADIGPDAPARAVKETKHLLARLHIEPGRSTS